MTPAKIETSTPSGQVRVWIPKLLVTVILILTCFLIKNLFFFYSPWKDFSGNLMTFVKVLGILGTLGIWTTNSVGNFLLERVLFFKNAKVSIVPAILSLALISILSVAVSNLKPHIQIRPVPGSIPEDTSFQKHSTQHSQGIAIPEDGYYEITFDTIFNDVEEYRIEISASPFDVHYIDLQTEDILKYDFRLDRILPEDGKRIVRLSGDHLKGIARIRLRFLLPENKDPNETPAIEAKVLLIKEREHHVDRRDLS